MKFYSNNELLASKNLNSFFSKIFSLNFNKISYELFIALLIISFSCYLIFFHFNYFVLTNDDYFVLAERVFFSNNSTLSWLNHLLFFNQTRLTWVGDITLFRPGLFFLQWLYFEIIFPYNPSLLKFIISIVNIFSLVGIFYFVRRYSNILFAFLCVIFMSIIDGGYIAFIWIHINPYVLSIGCFCWWLSLYDKEKDWPILFLVISTLLHDIFGIFVILLALTCLTTLFLKKEIISDYFRENKPIFLCAIFYLFLRITSLIFILLTNDGILIITSYLERLFIYLNDFFYLIQIEIYGLTFILFSFLIFLLNKIKKISKDLIVLFLILLFLGTIILIFGKFYFNFISTSWLDAIDNFAFEFSKRLSFNLIVFRVIFYLSILAIIITILTILTKRKTDEIIFLISPILLSFLFIFILIFGRIIVRGGFGDWYILFIQFSTICMLMSIVQFISKNKNFILSSFTILISFFSLQNILDVSSQLKIKKLNDSHKSTQWIKLHKIIKKNSKHNCLKGILPSNEVTKISMDYLKGISKDLYKTPFKENYILFNKFYCHEEKDLRNKYYLIENDGKYEHIPFYRKKKNIKNEFFFPFDQSKILSSFYLTNLPNYKTKYTPVNFYEAWGNVDNSNCKSRLFSRTKRSNKILNQNYAIKISRNFNSNDKLFNTALIIKKEINQLPKFILNFIDNNLEVWAKSKISDKFELISAGLIPFSKTEITVEFLKVSENLCNIEINSIVSTALKKCPDYPHYIETMQLYNGTKTENKIEILLFKDKL